MELLFSYGTLQQEIVQVATFGRHRSGQPALIGGYRSDWLWITDPAMIAVSGSDRHPPVRPGDDPAGFVSGTVFAITAEEPVKADGDAVSDCSRVRASLVEGGEACVHEARR